MGSENSFPAIISASRRTDIPAFYMDWFMQGISRGYFDVKNPFNGKVSRVPADPDRVHSIVFWSKNFRRFIEGGYGRVLRAKGYTLFFNYTINSESGWLEPRIPPLDQRLEDLENLSSLFGSKVINWRFDPVVFFKPPGGPAADNLQDFPKIAEAAGKLGINRCITSFMDLYAKVKKRISSVPGFEFRDPPLEKKVRVLERMKQVLDKYRISLYTCCEKDVLEALPAESGIRRSSCISGSLLMELFGGRVSLRKDSGQRAAQGCGCTVSSDIGSYKEQPCYHNCLFCYANPSSAYPEDAFSA